MSGYPINSNQNIYQERALAKINLRLRIEGRRQDGYHLLSMLNATTSLADSLEVQFGGTEVKLESSGLPLNCHNLADNLIVKAFIGFCQHFSINVGAHIKIHKVIPIGAGLGGGSSDAAAMLRICAKAWNQEIMEDRNLSAKQFLEQLYYIAQKIGSDVPFCLLGGFAATFGVGEQVRLLSCPEMENWPIYILKPKISILTTEFYSYLRSTFKTDLLQIDDAARALIESRKSQLDVSNIFTLVRNDFLTALKGYNPELDDIISEFTPINGATVSLSGSGSAFFVLPKLRSQAIEVLAEVKSLVKLRNIEVFESRLSVFPEAVDFFSLQK